MIPFDEFDVRLTDLGKDRSWLAKATRLSPTYIASILARNSLRRSDGIRKRLSDAIEEEEIAQNGPPMDSGRLMRTHKLLRDIAPESYPIYCRAAEAEKLTLEAWLLQAANEKATRVMLREA